MADKKLSGAAAVAAAGPSAERDAYKIKERLTRAKTARTVIQIVAGVKDLGMRTFQPSEFNLLNIAEPGTPGHVYQRGEDRRRVNELMGVLAQGGIIPEAIQVAVRKDGTFWIVDGGQRFRAHFLMEMPIKAQLWGCQTIEQERQLFSVEQRRSMPKAGTRVQAWVGPAGDLLRWLGESTQSPICGEVDMYHSGGAPSARRWGVTALVIGLQGVLTGSGRGGGLEDVLRLCDIALRDIGPTEGRRRAVLYVSLLKRMFEDRRINRQAVIAMGRVCGEHWRGARALEPPSEGVMRRLQKVNWDDVVRGNSGRWERAALEALVALWPLPKGAKADG